MSRQQQQRLQAQPQYYPQPTGFPPQQQQQQGFYIQPQHTGFGQPNLLQQRPRIPPPPPLPQFQQPRPTGFAGVSGFNGAGVQQSVLQNGFAAKPQQQPRFLTSSPINTGPLIQQTTGWGGAGTLMSQLAGSPWQNPLQSTQAQNQSPRGDDTRNNSWALSKAEQKSYDGIFRAWDTQGTGFISGQTARSVFGQSGLSKDDLALIWTLADRSNRGSLNLAEFHVAMGLIYRALNGTPIPTVLPRELIPPSDSELEASVNSMRGFSTTTRERTINDGFPALTRERTDTPVTSNID